MNKIHKIAIVLFAVFALPAMLKGQEQPKAVSIDSYFAPPAIYKNQYGKFRSPLLFSDGKKVKNPTDWQKRRAEILSEWHGMMGAWPALIEKQDVEILKTTQHQGYKEYYIRYNWLPNEKTNGYLLVPDGGGKKPAVITVFYEPETAIGTGRKTPNLDFALQLTKRGFVTLSIGTADATKDKNYSLFYPSIKNSTVQPLSLLAYAAANSWYVLANRAEVDEERIGIMGLSFGGKWAMFASCLFEKFACGVWSDPGVAFENTASVNYYEPYYLGYHPKPWRKRGVMTKDNPAKGLYPKLVAEGHDLHEIQALMAPRPFLVSGGSEDPISRWIPLNHSIAVNKVLGYKDRVAMTNREKHLPDALSNEQAYLFLERFLMKGSAAQQK